MQIIDSIYLHCLQKDMCVYMHTHKDKYAQSNPTYSHGQTNIHTGSTFLAGGAKA